jgi:hypothetical protein
LKDQAAKFLMGWEPRGDWDAALVAELCRELDLVHVVDPSRHCGTASQNSILPARPGGSRHRFTTEELQLQRVLRKTPTYCLFNNVAMASDATTATAFLPKSTAGKSASVHALAPGVDRQPGFPTHRFQRLARPNRTLAPVPQQQRMPRPSRR